MATKYINLQYDESAITVYARIQQESSGNWYEDPGGTFVAFGSSGVIALTEDANVKRKYSWSGGASAAWANGIYHVYAYKQAGGSPDVDNDEAVGSGLIAIESNAEIQADTIDGNVDTLVDRITSGRASNLDNLDTTVSSRSSHSAAAVWAVATRTLTSFGTLIADVWAYATRILTAGTKDAEIDAITAIVTDTRRVVKNKLTIDEDNSNLLLWDDAGTSVLYTWPLTDRSANAISLQAGPPSNRGVPT